MITVSFADLQSQVDFYFQAVEKGESLQVSREGRPIALITPLPTVRAKGWPRIAPLPIEGISLTSEILADRQESN